MAPAKINLRFQILGKREDGFHDVDTLMVPLQLADILTIERTSSRELHFSCDDPALPTDRTNLVVQAMEAFKNATGVNDGIRVHLQKIIPHGAGLAGGSSDAATTLMGLDALFETRLSLEILTRLAAKTGSDVPFFLHHSAAVCTGRGEIIAPVPDFPPLPLLLIKPGFSVSTPWAYKQWAAARPVPGFSYAPQNSPWGSLRNDLEMPVFEKFPFCGLLKQWLLNRPETAAALMSGSGSTVFAVLNDKKDAEPLLEEAREEFGTEFWAWHGMSTGRF